MAVLNKKNNKNIQVDKPKREIPKLSEQRKNTFATIETSKIFNRDSFYDRYKEILTKE